LPWVDSGNRRLRTEATSTRSTATLQVFVSSSGQLIGTLSNDGGGRYRGEFSGPVNPQSITVRSNFVGQAARTVTVRQPRRLNAFVCGSKRDFWLKPA
jgi:hypothetical protein